MMRYFGRLGWQLYLVDDDIMSPLQSIHWCVGLYTNSGISDEGELAHELRPMVIL
jgi:hypothetical protein